MPNPNPPRENLKPFSTDYQPEKRGRKSGSQNVSKLVIKALETFAPGVAINPKQVREFLRKN